MAEGFRWGAAGAVGRGSRAPIDETVNEAGSSPPHPTGA